MRTRIPRLFVGGNAPFGSEFLTGENYVTMIMRSQMVLIIGS